MEDNGRDGRGIDTATVEVRRIGIERKSDAECYGYLDHLPVDESVDYYHEPPSLPRVQFGPLHGVSFSRLADCSRDSLTDDSFAIVGNQTPEGKEELLAIIKHFGGTFVPDFQLGIDPVDFLIITGEIESGVTDLAMDYGVRRMTKEGFKNYIKCSSEKAEAAGRRAARGAGIQRRVRYSRH
jgi:hypothetical protein